MNKLHNLTYGSASIQHQGQTDYSFPGLGARHSQAAVVMATPEIP